MYVSYASAVMEGARGRAPHQARQQFEAGLASKKMGRKDNAPEPRPRDIEGGKLKEARWSGEKHEKCLVGPVPAEKRCWRIAAVAKGDRNRRVSTLCKWRDSPGGSRFDLLVASTARVQGSRCRTPLSGLGNDPSQAATSLDKGGGVWQAPAGSG